MSGKGSIMIVASECDWCNGLIALVQSWGYFVKRVGDGETALDAIELVHPDLILINSVLPGMDGVETCRIIRLKESWSAIPIMVLTEEHDQEAKVQSLLEGANDYVVKPVHEIELQAKIKNLLTVKRLYDQLQSHNTELEMGMRIRKRVEKSLRVTSTRLQKLVENMRIAIMVEDESRQVLIVNKSFLSLFEISEPEKTIIGDSHVHRKYLAPCFDSSDFFMRRVDECIALKQTVIGEELRTKDGRVLERDFIPISLESDYHGHLWMFGDITLHKKAELAIAKTREKEVEIGRRLQEGLFAKKEDVELDGVELGVVAMASQRIDGDFYDIISYKKNTADILVADVMGKGIPAAILGAETKSRFPRVVAQLLPKRPRGKLPTTNEIVNGVHQLTSAQISDLHQFVTLGYARVDMDEKKLYYVDAGHTKPMLFRHRTGEVDYLVSNNVPLGFLEDEEYSEMIVSLDDGDCLLLYSDGLTEAKNAKGEMFGEVRIERMLKRFAHLPAAELAERYRENVMRFMEKEVPSDDLTIVSLKIKASEPDFPIRRAMRYSTSVDRLHECRDDLHRWLEQPDWGMEDAKKRNDFIVAVWEAICNIWEHAQKRKADGIMFLDLVAGADAIRIELTYPGEEFQRKQVKKPDFSGKRGRGYGVYIMENLVDDVHYSVTKTGLNRIELSMNR